MFLKATNITKCKCLGRNAMVKKLMQLESVTSINAYSYKTLIFLLSHASTSIFAICFNARFSINQSFAWTELLAKNSIRMFDFFVIMYLHYLLWQKYDEAVEVLKSLEKLHADSDIPSYNANVNALKLYAEYKKDVQLAEKYLTRM